MREFDDRMTANLDLVLESVCRELPHSGGDHETRKFIAHELMRAVRGGEKTPKELEDVARRALQELTRSRIA